MARLGINYNDVAQAADSITASGERATVDRIREYLGTGSKSTITPLLKRWREQQADSSVLPEHLQLVVTKIYETLQTEAFENAESEKTLLKQRLDVAIESKTKAEQQAIEALENIEAIDTQLKTEIQRSESAEKGNAALLQQNMELSAKNQHLEIYITDIKEQLNEQKQINRRQSESAEHYQQHIAEERSLERQQFEQQLKLKQDELRQLRQDHQQTQQNLQSLKEKQNQLMLDNQSLQRDCNDLEDANETLSQQLLTESKTVERLKLERDQSDEKLDALRIQHDKSNHESQLSQNALLAELESARRKIIEQQSNYQELKQQVQTQEIACARLEAKLSVYEELADQPGLSKTTGKD